jgi:hypothetical protein
VRAILIAIGEWAVLTAVWVLFVIAFAWVFGQAMDIVYREAGEGPRPIRSSSSEVRQ